MLDVGWSELLVIAVVLIVVVGPKDLPPMLRAFGKMTARMRAMAGEFRAQFDEALKEAELDEVRKTIGDAQRLNPMNTIREAINPLRQTANEIRADLQDAASTTPVKRGPEPVPASGESAAAVSPAAVSEGEAALPQPENQPSAPMQATAEAAHDASAGHAPRAEAGDAIRKDGV